MYYSVIINHRNLDNSVRLPNLIYKFMLHVQYTHTNVFIHAHLMHISNLCSIKDFLFKFCVYSLKAYCMHTHIDLKKNYAFVSLLLHIIPIVNLLSQIFFSKTEEIIEIGHTKRKEMSKRLFFHFSSSRKWALLSLFLSLINFI